MQFGESIMFRRNMSPPSSGSKLSLLPASASFFLGLLFDPERGDDIALLNLGFSLNYTAL
jgi:hypothetical protein